MKIVEFIHDEDHPEVTNLDKWLKESSNHESEKIIVRESTILPNTDKVDLIILHGGSQHLWDKDKDPWLYKEIEYVQDALKNRIPVVGFCLGAQIIAEALGGVVYKAEEKEVGWFKVNLREEAKQHILLKGLEDGLTSFMWHSDHYSITEDCTSLGFTEAAENQIFISNNYPAVGFQFHPEYTKENIETYLVTYEEEHWSGGKYAVGKEYFKKQTVEIPETYDLFKKLVKNSILWLRSKTNKRLV